MSKKKDTFMCFEEFLELWMKLPEEKKTALEEFVNAGKDMSVEQAIDQITNEEVRVEFRQVLKAEGHIA